jgi:hypothetical protein
MPVLISGILRDGAGKPVQDCTIQLSAKQTSPTVVVEVDFIHSYRSGRSLQH